jgi:hypothetical protein
MSIGFWSLVLLLMVSPMASAATITIDFGAPETITPTAKQIAKMEKRLARVNTQRTAQGLSTLTIEQFLKNASTTIVEQETQEGGDTEAQQSCENYAAATTEVKNTIDTALGGLSPCP